MIELILIVMLNDEPRLKPTFKPEELTTIAEGIELRRSREQRDMHLSKPTEAKEKGLHGK